MEALVWQGGEIVLPLREPTARLPGSLQSLQRLLELALVTMAML